MCLIRLEKPQRGGRGAIRLERHREKPTALAQEDRKKTWRVPALDFKVSSAVL
jgi:hypothetical protein